MSESTTPDLAERTRLNLEAASSGDLDSVLFDLAPRAVWEVPAQSLRVDGATAIRDFLEKWRSPFEDWSFRVEKVLDLGNQMILVVYRQRGRAPGSTFVVEDRGVQVCEWSEGSIVALRLYAEIDEARAATERLAEQRE
jgi:ketosteroid isomerase-like protein